MWFFANKLAMQQKRFSYASPFFSLDNIKGRRDGCQTKTSYKRLYTSNMHKVQIKPSLCYDLEVSPALCSTLEWSPNKVLHRFTLCINNEFKSKIENLTWKYGHPSLKKKTKTKTSTYTKADHWNSYILDPPSHKNKAQTHCPVQVPTSNTRKQVQVPASNTPKQQTGKVISQSFTFNKGNIETAPT